MEGKGKIILAHENYDFTDKFAKAVESCGYEVNVVKSPADIVKKIEASGNTYDLIGLPFDSASLRDVSILENFLDSPERKDTKLFAIMPKSARFSQTVLAKIKALKPLDFISESSSSDEIVFRLSNILFEDMGQRKNFRALMNMTVHCDYMQDFFDAESFTISKDGMFLKTNRQLPRGTKIFLNFSLPNNGKDFSTMGNIIYSINPQTPKPRISPPGAGVYFVDLNNDERKYIDKHIRGSA